MAGRYCYKDLLPFVALVTMECTNVGLNTLFKAATLKGMSSYVFMVYSYAIAALILLPAPFFSLRSRVLPPLSSSILCKIALLGFIGCSSSISGYTGIGYSSPTLASAISNLTPAFTFLLAILFRMEKVSFKKTSSVAKVMGTVVSIAGAFIVTLYKGPIIISASPPSVSLHHQKLVESSSSNWAIGGAFLMVEYLLIPLWYIIQTQIMKEYPAELTVICFYDLCVSFLAAIVTLFIERDNGSAWIIKPNVALASIVSSGLFGSCINNSIHTWALRIKGPLFVAMFKPLSIVVAVVMGFMFLGDALHLGSVIGATIISIGFYTVMWGKSVEEIGEEDCIDEDPDPLDSSPVAGKEPLLKSYKSVQV